MLKETMLFATKQRYNALVGAAELSGRCSGHSFLFFFNFPIHFDVWSMC